MNIAIFGASGGIGNALLQRLAADATHTVYAFSRSPIATSSENVICRKVEFENEASIEQAAHLMRENAQLDHVFVCTGMLHECGDMPEKSFKALSATQLMNSYFINVVGPALVAKHVLPLLSPSPPSVFAVLSARVGSISDNRLGGWYAYRSSKAALNMLIKNLSIEMSRKNAHAVIVGLHPGTVDTNLSQPFQARIPKDRLFSPEQAAAYLLKVLENLKPEHSGRVYAWDRKEVLP